MAHDDWPLFGVFITDIGPAKSKVFSLIRESLGLSPGETKALLQRPDAEVARGARLEIDSLVERLRSVGAKVACRIVTRPERVSVADVLDHMPDVMYRPVAVDGHLIVTSLFSYLASEQYASQGILVLQPQLESRLLACAPPMGGSMVSYSSYAIVEGILCTSTGLPMFPVQIHSVAAVTYFHADWEPLRIEFVDDVATPGDTIAE